MKPKQLSKLTPEEKRIAIAKLAGWLPERRWRFFYDAERQHGTINMRSREEATEFRKHNIEDWVRCGGDASTVSEIEEYDEYENAPDFLNDLNAMHEVEKALDTSHEIEFYMERLTDTCGGDTELGKASFVAYFATAEQRADAFLLTKG